MKRSAAKKAAPKRTKPSFLAVDFFCGAGGTTRGLIDAGGYVIAGVDKDVRCERTYVDNNVNTKVDYAPARFLNHDIFPASADHPGGEQKQLVKELGGLIDYYRSRCKNVPLLFAICAPCQPFTRLSRKKMSKKRVQTRARDMNLLREAAKFVRRYKPEIVLSENVAGINDPKYGGVWDSFRKSLERAGYVTGSKVVCTSRFGVPQFRKRSILMAVRKDVIRPDRFADMWESELLVPEADPDASMVSVAEAIGHLPPIGAGEYHLNVPNHRTRGMSDLNKKRLSAAKPGESNAYMENTRHGDLSLDCHRRVNRKLRTRCFSDVYTRMHPDRPSPTITTKCHSISNGRFGHYDIKQVRGLSLREAAILQSFPDDYVFFPDDEVEPVARMIGNAVPPRLAEFFASYLANSVLRAA
ncbi:MAG: DNA cytosine methyltransferase [Hyphomonadaceae bacterium]|nr:DNA cytosine methyltransferase [Hyphomonadaceae bacterium]